MMIIGKERRWFLCGDVYSAKFKYKRSDKHEDNIINAKNIKKITSENINNERWMESK